jgi:hypothetical protein
MHTTTGLSSVITEDLVESVDGKTAAQRLAAHGSDCAFFMLDEDGNDLDC